MLTICSMVDLSIPLDFNCRLMHVVHSSCPHQHLPIQTCDWKLPFYSKTNSPWCEKEEKWRQKGSHVLQQMCQSGVYSKSDLILTDVFPDGLILVCSSFENEVWICQSPNQVWSMCSLIWSSLKGLSFKISIFSKSFLCSTVWSLRGDVCLFRSYLPTSVESKPVARNT